MPATETRLPLGNEWEFSARNSKMELRPGPGRTEITQPSGVLFEVVQNVQDRFIVEGWQFAALVQCLPTEHDYDHHLVAVFTHPSRTKLLESWGHNVAEFLKVDRPGSDNGDPIFYDYDYKPENNDPLNEILKGTNFVYRSILAGHLGVKVGSRNSWQTGVGFFRIDLETYQQLISEVDAQRDALMKKISPLQEQKAALIALQSPHPVPLFQTG